MDGEGQAPEDLNVSLSWPGDDQEDTERDLRRNPAVGRWTAEEATEETSRPEGTTTRRPPGASDELRPAVTGSSPATNKGLGDPADMSASTTVRLDMLTDAMITLRSFVNERMGDVGDAVARSKTQISHELEQGFSRIQAETTRGLDEALLGMRAQIAKDLKEATTEGRDQMAQQIGAVLDRMESQANRRSANDERRHEQTAAAVQATVTKGEDAVRLIEDVGTAISTELATVGQRLSDQVDATHARSASERAALEDQVSAVVDDVTEAARVEVAAASQQLAGELMTAITATGKDARERTEQIGAEIAELSESVADALTQVADRLEQLAINNHGQQDVVEAVAQALDDVAGRLDDLDSSNRSRQERIVAAIEDLRSKRSQVQPVDLEPLTSGLERIETFVEALVDAADDTSSAEKTVVAHAVERLESLETTIGAQFNDATMKAIQNLTEAAERAASQIKTAVPPMTERSTLAAMTRIEGRLAEMTRQREEHDQATKEMLDSLEETVSRLASAQAEDLERILDTVESDTARPQPASLSLSPADAQRLTQIEEALRKVNSGPKPVLNSADIDGTALEQMAILGNQIEALRRRMALRARPQTPALDAGALEAIAQAVVARLVPPAGPPPQAVPAKKTAPARRAAKPRAPGTRTAKQSPTSATKATRSRAQKP